MNLYSKILIQYLKTKYHNISLYQYLFTMETHQKVEQIFCNIIVSHKLHDPCVLSTCGVFLHWYILSDCTRCVVQYLLAAPTAVVNSETTLRKFTALCEEAVCVCVVGLALFPRWCCWTTKQEAIKTG